MRARLLLHFSSPDVTRGNTFSWLHTFLCVCYRSFDPYVSQEAARESATSSCALGSLQLNVTFTRYANRQLFAYSGGERSRPCVLPVTKKVIESTLTLHLTGKCHGMIDWWLRAVWCTVSFLSFLFQCVFLCVRYER